MLSENKFSKYLIYGIGEIILVVIGILIALQINNWNENQKNRSLALNYLKNVKSDLVQDTTIFSRTLKDMNQFLDYKKWGLQQNDLSNLSSMYLEALTASKYFNIQSNDQAFTKMNDPNVLNMVEFDSVYRKINIYFTFNQDYLKSFNDWDKETSLIESNYWNRQDNFEVTSYITPEDSINIFQNEVERQKALVLMLSSIEGRNQIKFSFFRIKSMQGIYKRQLETATSVLQSIDEILEFNTVD